MLGEVVVKNICGSQKLLQACSRLLEVMIKMLTGNLLKNLMKRALEIALLEGSCHLNQAPQLILIKLNQQKRLSKDLLQEQ